MSETIERESNLAVIVRQNALAPETAEKLLATFTPLYDEADKLVTEAQGISVPDATHVKEIKQARDVRLKLRKVRIAAEAARKEAKENFLRGGRAVDAIAGKVKGWCEPAEERLEEMEKIAERAEAKRKADLVASRQTILTPYLGTDVMMYPLADMTEDAFQRLYDTSKASHEAKIAAEKKAEEERLAAEKAKAEEDARIRAENERLRLEQERQERERKAEAERVARERAEAEAKAAAERAAIEAAHRAELEKQAAERRAAEEAARAEREEYERMVAEKQRAVEEKARKEREEMAAKARAEAEAREKLEREVAAQKEAERKRLAAEEAAARKAARAPDKVKILAFAEKLDAIELPTVNAAEAKKIVVDARAMLENIRNYLNNEGSKL